MRREGCRAFPNRPKEQPKGAPVKNKRSVFRSYGEEKPATYRRPLRRITWISGRFVIPPNRAVASTAV